MGALYSPPAHQPRPVPGPFLLGVGEMCSSTGVLQGGQSVRSRTDLSSQVDGWGVGSMLLGPVGVQNFRSAL